jgi:branched-chain amino acid transport system substrate-binding protein
MKLFRCIVLSLALAAALSDGHAQGRPAELKFGMTTFLTGPASVFGIPGKQAAELIVEDINAAGGIDGVKLRPIFIDEGLGADRLLSEYRRVVQEEGAKVMLAAISSGSCLSLAPVAEDLKVLNLLWDCSTERVLEEHRYRYVARTLGNSTSEVAATVLHLLRVRPDFKTIAVINQDYAWGRDSWVLFMNMLRALKPDVQVVAELFPRFGATDFSSEISRLQALSPDVVFNASWGGDLDTFVRQGSQRGLFRNRTTWVMPLAESSLERVGKAMPDGVIVGMRGDHYFLHPDWKDDPKHKAFVQKYRNKTGQYPIYPAYHAVAAVQGLVDAYKAALKTTAGRWPSPEQVSDAMRTLEFRGLTSPVKMREDGQGLADQMLGVSKMTSAYPFPVIDKLTVYPAAVVQNPAGTKGVEWVKTAKPELVRDPRIKGGQ